MLKRFFKPVYFIVLTYGSNYLCHDLVMSERKTICKRIYKLYLMKYFKKTKISTVQLYWFHYYMFDSRKSCSIICFCYLIHVNNVPKLNKIFWNFVHAPFSFKAINYHICENCNIIKQCCTKSISNREKLFNKIQTSLLDTFY
jgi:hypothetical protein